MDILKYNEHYVLKFEDNTKCLNRPKFQPNIILPEFMTGKQNQLILGTVCGTKGGRQIQIFQIQFRTTFKICFSQF